jgi:predicted MFS family arabinose efflux permease
MFAARLFTGKLYNRFGLLPLLTPTLILGIVSLLLIALSHNFYLFCLSGALNGLSLGIAMPVLNTVALESAAPDRRGAASSTFFIGTDLGIGIAASLWGLVIDATSFETAFLGSAGCIVLTIAVAYLLLRSRQAPARPSAA